MTGGSNLDAARPSRSDRDNLSACAQGHSTATHFKRLEQHVQAPAQHQRLFSASELCADDFSLDVNLCDVGNEDFFPSHDPSRAAKGMIATSCDRDMTRSLAKYVNNVSRLTTRQPSAFAGKLAATAGLSVGEYFLRPGIAMSVGGQP